MRKRASTHILTASALGYDSVFSPGRRLAARPSDPRPGVVTASPVLQACGLPAEFATGTLRLSVGRHTTEQDVLRAADQIGSVVAKLLARGGTR